MKTKTASHWTQWLFGLLAISCAAATGCQVTVGGQTLPSGYYIEDDVQYFAPGPEMPLSEEAAAQKEFNADQALLDRP